MASPDVPDLDEYREQVQAWLRDNLPRRQANSPLRAGHDISPEQLASERAQQRRLYEAGYAGIAIPVEYGGQGLSVAHEKVWQREASSYALPMPGGIAFGVTVGIVLPTVLAYASEDQKRSWVPKMLSADEIWVQLLSEPGAGSDLAAVLTRATQAGEDWVLNGTKVWSSGAMSADYGVCLARTNWDVPKHRGLTWFKVPLRDDHVTVRPIREVNGGADFCEEFLDDVVVGPEMVLGEVDGGWPIANAMLGFERTNIGNAAGQPSGARNHRSLPADLLTAADIANAASDPLARQAIARIHAEDVVLGMLARRIGAAVMKGQMDAGAVSYLKLGQGTLQPDRACVAMEIAARGAVAWTAESAGQELATSYLNGRIMAIAGGSNQIQRNIISERVLGLPREPSEDRGKSFSDVLRDARNWGQ
jgi:alkylation response protein AidB-like acyl-CoA dehydrogenase